MTRRKIKIKSIKDVKNLSGKKVLLRTDFNVPINKGKVTEDFKIIASLPTIRFLVRYGAKVVIISHLGRPKFTPKGSVKNKKEATLKPVALRLSKLLGVKVKFSDDCLGEKTRLEIDRLKNGQVILLENIRFYKEEKKNNEVFAAKLAMNGDIYVNDAFGVSHRAQASVSAIKKYRKSYAGILLEKEIRSLNAVLEPKKPLISVVGGAKISTKLPLIKKIQKKSLKILVGGALANNFFVINGLEIGKSLVDKESIKIVKKLKSDKILLPIDVIVAEKGNMKKAKVKNIKGVGKQDVILDIGPETIKLYSSFIKKAETIIWNGPMGKFEDKSFRSGTDAIAQVIAARSRGKAFGVVGGGETAAALKEIDMFDYVDWVSTGGGAMLSFLGGEKMPGIKGLISK